MGSRYKDFHCVGSGKHLKKFFFFFTKYNFFMYCKNVTILHMSKDNNTYNKYTTYKRDVNDTSRDVMF